MLILKLPSSLNQDTEKDVNKIIDTLDTSDKDQEIGLKCSGYGGDVLIACNVINAIITSPAKVSTLVDGECCSSHADIALCRFVDSVIIYPVGVYFEIHDAKVSLSYQTKHLKERSEFYHDFYNKYAEYIGVMDLLTPKEKEIYYDGKDLLLVGKEMISRVSKRNKLYAKAK